MSSTLNRWLKRLYKLLAILLVSFAVLISTLRLFLPYAHNYRQQVENYLNNNYQANISIGELAMGWEGSGPSLVVKDVVLLSSNNANIEIKSFEVDVDFWRSLRTRKLVTQDVTISGAEIEINQRAELAAERAIETTDDTQTMQQSIETIFLEQISRFSVADSHVYVKTNNGERAFSIKQLSWMNESSRHQAQGTITLDGISANNIQLSVDLTGQELATLKGQVYLAANNLNITPWLGRTLALDDDDTHSAINFNAWLDIDNGDANTALISFGENEISWQHQNKNELFEVDGGDIVIHTKAPGVYQLFSTPFNVKRNGLLVEPLSLQARVDSLGIEGHISQLNLASLQGIMPLLSENDELNALLSGLATVGVVNDIYFRKHRDEVAVAAAFSDITFQYSEGIPGVQNLSGDLVYYDQQLRMKVRAVDGSLDFDKHFMRPIPYRELTALVDARFTANDWQLLASEITYGVDELKLTADIEVVGGKEKPIKMALLANVSGGDAKNADYYYPHLLMGNDLVDYLNSAIVSGKVEQAQVLFNGPLNAFPFNHNEGIFVVNAELFDSTFSFDSEWPAIENFAANLNFTNNSMLITGRSGQLTGIDVTGVEAAIASLSDEQVLTVDADFTQVSPINVEKLMNNSPMQSSVGVTLTDVRVKKAVDGNFSLNLPLNKPEDVVASGLVNFVDNNVSLNAPSMDFTNVNGSLTFNNDIVEAEEVDLIWRGLPVQLNVQAQQMTQHYNVDIETVAVWQSEQWQSQLPSSLIKYGDGALNWQGKLNLAIQDDSFKYDYKLASTLDGVVLNLPQPFYKASDEKLTVSAHAYGDDKSSVIDADVGNNINFYGELDHQQVTFNLAHLVLGKQQFWLPTQGFHITADLQQANYQQWQPLVLDILTAVENEPTRANSASQQVSQNNIIAPAQLPLLPEPSRINGKVASVDVFGHNFNDIDFELTKAPHWMLLDLNGKEARVKAKFYPDWLEQGIDIDADFLHINALDNIAKTTTSTLTSGENLLAIDTQNSSTTKVINHISNAEIFANVPPLNVKCKSCKYGVYDFGEVTFDLSREDENTLLLNKFTAKRGKTNLAFDARWQQVQNTSQTKILGLLNSNNVEAEVENIGYASIIKDSGVEINYDVNWQGAPYDFAIATLNGDISAKFDDGYLADVDDKGVRILSILSLQSLVRKLSFDFRDIFSDGMFYRELKGDFTLVDGIAYTESVKMKGTAGDLNIIGNTNLNDGALDYKMSYKPNLTSSLPVLAWIATLNPVTFLAGVALDEVITSTVIAEIKFEVTGNLDDPQMKQVSRKNQNISVGRSTPPKIVDNQTELPNESKPETNKPPLIENKFDG